MKLYITRHGQVETDGEWPIGYVPLSALGREQARRLGARLVEMNFRGRILT